MRLHRTTLCGIGPFRDIATLDLAMETVLSARAEGPASEYPWLALRPALRWIARSDTPEIFTAAALLLVVGIAYLMVLVGLSMALGAFLAGVLLAESEYRRELETDIEPFKGLLLGLFFIAVGMSIDFAVVLAQPLLVAGIVLGFLLGPVWFGLAGFVGAGLVFAGVTGHCGMARLLVQLPWNRIDPPSASRVA